jgi:hypothetical protein
MYSSGFAYQNSHVRNVESFNTGGNAHNIAIHELVFHFGQFFFGYVKMLTGIDVIFFLGNYFQQMAAVFQLPVAVGMGAHKIDFFRIRSGPDFFGKVSYQLFLLVIENPVGSVMQARWITVNFSVVVPHVFLFFINCMSPSQGGYEQYRDDHPAWRFYPK